MAERRSVLEAVEGFHLAAVVHGLDQLEVLDRLSTPQAPRDLADAIGVDGHLLQICLDYVAGRSELVDRHGDRFVITESWNDHARALVRQYVGAYGALSVRVTDVLGAPQDGPHLVDRGEHARSYAVAPSAARLVGDIVQQLGLTPTVDLGCGTATMLIDLARRDPDFVGWGVDASGDMCAAARAAAAAEGVGDRVTIVQGNALDPRQPIELPTEEVRCLTATSLLNELWAPERGPQAVAAWLGSLSSVFPGRALVVADYFGRLGWAPPPWPPQTAVHDLVQALSGQGIPPADRGPWLEVYRDARSQLLHMVEDADGSFFIHLLRLADEGGAAGAAPPSPPR